MDEFDSEFGYVLPDEESDIMEDELQGARLGFNFTMCDEEEDNLISSTSTGVLIREIMSRHPEAVLMVVPPKSEKYSCFTTTHRSGERSLSLAAEALGKWADNLGMDFDYEIQDDNL